MIYLDTAASYPLLPIVLERMEEAFRSMYANSASSHAEGEKASNTIKNVRDLLADTIGAYSSEIIFTSGATESNNLALKGYLTAQKNKTEKNHIVTTSIEHKCIFSICDYLKSIGFTISYVKPRSNGLILPEDIAAAIRPDTALVSVMHVNNELGTINDIKSIGELCFENQIAFHVDAAQSFGKLDIDVDDLNVDLMSFSAHKIGGPKGIGALYVRDLRHVEITPLIHGAGQEFSMRGGTVAAPLVVGFGEAISSFPIQYLQFSQQQTKLKLLTYLNDSGIKYSINGDIENSVPHCISITFENIDTETFLIATSETYCLAQGSACSSKEIEPSHVLTSIGMNRENANKTFRISFTLDISNNQLLSFAKSLRNFRV